MSTHTFAGETGSRAVEEVANRHPGLVTVGRLGWVAKGVVYALVGALAIPIYILIVAVWIAAIVFSVRVNRQEKGGAVAAEPSSSRVV